MRYSKALQLSVFLMLASIALFSACDVSNNNSNNGKGQFAVKLTDAPANYDAVFIDIQAIKVKAQNDNGGWITINDKPRRVNLLKLQNGDAILLGKEELETGFYHQIRLILGTDNAIVIDGQAYPLKTPSAQQSGLKLNIDANVEEGETYVLLIDFNAAKSIVKAGKSGKYILKPVIRTVELGKTGSIKGTVQPANFQTQVSAIANGDTLTAYTEDGGNFKFIGVREGTYNVVFNVPDAVAYADTTLTGVEVAVDEDVDLGAINLPGK